MDPQARPIHQFRHQAGCALHQSQNSFYLLAGQDHGHPVAMLDAPEPVHFPQSLLKHAVIKKGQCVECLALGRSRYLAFDGQVVQERLHFLGAENGRMLFVVEEDELANPVPIGLLGSGAEMSATADRGNLVQ